MCCIFTCVFQYLVVGIPNTGARQQTPSYCRAEKQPHHISLRKYEFPKYFPSQRWISKIFLFANMNFLNICLRKYEFLKYFCTQMWISKQKEIWISKLHHTSVPKYEFWNWKILLYGSMNFWTAQCSRKFQNAQYFCTKIWIFNCKICSNKTKVPYKDTWNPQFDGSFYMW